MRSGLKLLDETPGTGPAVERQRTYRIRLRMWLNRGDPVKWERPWGVVDRAELHDEGTTLVTDVHLNRGSLMNGLFYGMDGMRVGGTRRLEISPHVGYGEQGVPGIIPAGAVLTAEVTVLEERPWP